MLENTTTQAAETGTSEVTIALSPAQLEAVASVAVAAAKPKEITPIIQTVQVSVIAGVLHAVATDRYRVARVTFPLNSDVEENGKMSPLVYVDGVCLPVAWLTGFAKAVKSSKTVGVSILTIAGSDLTFSNEYAGLSARTMAQLGNYPPVARLIPADDQFAEDGTPSVNLNLKYVADADKLRHPALAAGDYIHGAMRMRFTKTANPAKPGPVLFDRSGIKPEDGTVEYLLQPNLMLSKR